MKEPFSLHPFHVGILDSQDQPALFELLSACEDYSMLVSGSPAIEQDAIDLLNSLPPGKRRTDKYILGFTETERTPLHAFGGSPMVIRMRRELTAKA